MTLLRRFLAIQSLMIWQGGFFFYAAVVVPIGTDVLGTFDQGRVTRHVTEWMNRIGIATLVLLCWDQWSAPNRWRWRLWTGMAISVPVLFWLHGEVEKRIDFGPEQRVTDFASFYAWHRAYLYVATAQWLLGLAYLALTLRVWHSSCRTTEQA